MDGPEAWVANDYFFDPTTYASYTFLPNPFILDFKNKKNVKYIGMTISILILKQSEYQYQY